MVKKYFIFLLVLIALNLNFISSQALKNQIIVKVDNNIITDYELKNKLITSLILSNQEINQINIDKNKRRALNYLIDLKLKINELIKYNVEIDKLNVNDQLLSMSSSNITEFEKKFKAQGISFELFVKELKIETAWKQLMYNIYKEKVKINQNEIDKQVKNYIKNNSTIIELKISEIEINIEENSNYQNEINFIKKEIDKNGFEKTALKFSTSSSSKKFGDIGWINQESLAPQIKNNLINLKVGEVSSAIKDVNTISFFKITDKKISKVDDIDTQKLKSRITLQKQNELFNLYSRSHLSKLKNNSLIEYK